jgi:hypothetical protein
MALSFNMEVKNGFGFHKTVSAGGISVKSYTPKYVG